MDTGGINQLIGELRAVAASASGSVQARQAPATGGADFGQLLKAEIDKVNTVQQSAEKQAESFATGNTNMNLHDVMIELQKANVSFQQMIQVRNKLVTAFHDIMNMPV